MSTTPESGLHLFDADEQNEIIPIDNYNPEQGKLLASLSWLITKVYGKNIPDSLMIPCYKDDNNQMHLKPATLYCLTSGELYCAAASTIFHDSGYLNQSHSVVLQALKRYSIQVVDVDENIVTESVLTQAAPFKMNSHLAMIDALMTAYMREVISVQRVVQCLKKYANVHANESPSDVDEALLFWVNKICAAVRDNLEKHRVVKNVETPVIPEMEDIYEDICDGACIATLISFYAPDYLNLKDVCFNDPMSFGDSLHNLRLIKTACASCFPYAVFHFAYEDVLYLHESLQPNVNAFVTDLFYFFESSQNVKSPPPAGASVQKSFFNKSAIPDLRNSGKDSVSRQQHSNDYRPSISRPTKLNNHPIHTPREPSTVGHSVDTSRMNSTDSLLTDRSFDSLRYPVYKPNSTAGSPVTPYNGADFHTFTKSPTTTFGELNHTKTNVGTVGRSDSLNSHDVQNAKAPSYSVRMQLEEKRRQIETQKFLEKSERAKQGQQVNKDAFMKLYGKQPSMSTSMHDDSQSSTLERPTRDVGSAKPSTSGNAGGAKQKSLSQYDEISKSISEIKEQMKRLSVEQERLHQTYGSTATPPTSSAATTPSVMTQSFDGQSMQGPQQIYRPALVSSPLKAVGPFLANGHTMIRHSADAEPFRLHGNGDDAPLSRLDPALELTTNLSSWGMTYKSNKTPRRVWENNANINNQQQQEQQMHMQMQMRSPNGEMQRQQTSSSTPGGSVNAYAQSMVLMPVITEDINLMQQRVSPSHVEIIPSEPNWIPPAVNMQFVNSPIEAQPPSQMGATSCVPQPQTLQRAESDLSVYCTPSSNLEFNGQSTAENMNGENGFQGIIDVKQLPARSVSPLSGVGFIVDDANKQVDDELNRKKELIVANALRRKAQMEKRRGMLEEDNTKRQEELIKKEEMLRARKEEKEQRRLKVFEEYQKKKAEQEELEQQGAFKKLPSAEKSFTPIPSSSRSNGPKLPPRLANVGKSVQNVRSTSSSDNLDQADNKSQSSDGAVSTSQIINEPSLKLFVKPSQKSNRSIICNAIQYCVLAGSVNDDKRRKCLEELAKSDCKHFLVLFRDQKCQFRGLYAWDQCSDTVHKRFGLGPSTVSEKNLELLFKYDSGAKQFAEIPSKHFSATIDGFTINDSFWQSKKPLYGKSKTMK